MVAVVAPAERRGKSTIERRKRRRNGGWQRWRRRRGQRRQGWRQWRRRAARRRRRTSNGLRHGHATLPNRKTQQTIGIGGTTRYYLLNVPSGFDNKTALPLVFALHGYDMNNVSLVDLYDFTSQSGNKAITVLPQGEGPEPGTTSHWGDQVLKSTWTSSSYTFIQTLMTDIEKRFCVDTGRVFITGFSMGGMFTNSMACDHTDWFRAFAPVEGMGSCTKANAKPAIMIHQGTADTTVTPASGGEPMRDSWIKQNGCSSTGTSIYTGCTSYGNCSEPVIYCVGNWNHTVDRIAKANIWSFFNSLQ